MGTELLVERLETRGHVDSVPDQCVGHAFAAPDIAGDHGAGMDADAVAQRALTPLLAACIPAFQARLHLEGGRHGVVGVLRVGQRRTEYRLDFVADELQHQAAVGADGGIHFGEIRIQAGHHFLGRAGLHPGGEVAQVGKQDAHLALPAGGCRAPREDFVAYFRADVPAERVADALAVPQPGHHAVETFGHFAEFVVGHHRAGGVQRALLHACHGGLQLPQRSGHAVGHETGQPNGHRQPGDGQHHLHEHQVAHDGFMGLFIGTEQRVGPYQHGHRLHRDRHHAQEQEKHQQPGAHRQPQCTGPAQVAARQQRGQPPAPVVFGHQEDVRTDQGAGHDEDAETLARRACQLETALQQGPPDTPDQGRYGPADVGQPGQKGGHQNRPAAQ